MTRGSQLLDAAMLADSNEPPEIVADRLEEVVGGDISVIDKVLATLMLADYLAEKRIRPGRALQLTTFVLERHSHSRLMRVHAVALELDGRYADAATWRQRADDWENARTPEERIAEQLSLGLSHDGAPLYHRKESGENLTVDEERVLAEYLKRVKEITLLLMRAQRKRKQR